MRSALVQASLRCTLTALPPPRPHYTARAVGVRTRATVPRTPGWAAQSPAALASAPTRCAASTRCAPHQDGGVRVVAATLINELKDLREHRIQTLLHRVQYPQLVIAKGTGKVRLELETDHQHVGDVCLLQKAPVGGVTVVAHVEEGQYLRGRTLGAVKVRAEEALEKGPQAAPQLAAETLAGQVVLLSAGALRVLEGDARIAASHQRHRGHGCAAGAAGATDGVHQGGGHRVRRIQLAGGLIVHHHGAGCGCLLQQCVEAAQHRFEADFAAGRSARGRQVDGAAHALEFVQHLRAHIQQQHAGRLGGTRQQRGQRLGRDQPRGGRERVGARCG
eukprot:ctg_1680.g404